MVHHSQGFPSLTIITVSAFDSIRLRDTLLSLIQISNLDIEHLTVLPRKDQESISLWHNICGDKSNFNLLHDENRGIYTAMNLGASSARGKYLVFWNSGERITNHQEVIKLVETLQRSDSPQIITQGNIEWIPTHLQNNEMYQFFIAGDPRGFISHQTYFIKRESFLSLSGFSEKYKVVSDTDLILRMSTQEIEFEPSVTPVFVENSAYASSHHRQARMENLIMSLIFGLKRRDFRRFLNTLKNELLPAKNRLVALFEISAMKFAPSDQSSLAPNRLAWITNFGRAHVLSIFNAEVMSRLEDFEIKRVAIVGGTKSDPEALLISEYYPDFEIVTFGIESADVHLDLNLENEVDGASFDLVICSQVLEHVWNHENFFNNLAKLTCDGGLLWVACPASNKFHGSPDYYSAGFTADYLAMNLNSRRVIQQSMGGFGTKRLYISTHLIPGWFSIAAHKFPFLFAFGERKVIIRWTLRLRFVGFLLLLSLISPIKTTSSRWFTETWFLGRKLDT